MLLNDNQHHVIDLFIHQFCSQSFRTTNSGKVVWALCLICRDKLVSFYLEYNDKEIVRKDATRVMKHISDYNKKINNLMKNDKPNPFESDEDVKRYLDLAIGV